jgi:hypothetical protein
MQKTSRNAGVLALLALFLACAWASGAEKPDAKPQPAPAAEWTREPYKPSELLAKVPAPKGAWKFVAFGDCHAVPDMNANVLDAFKKTFDLTEKQDPALTLLLGDIVTGDRGIGIASWQVFFRLAGEQLARRPYFFAIGNHDIHDPSLPPLYEKIFTPPNPVAGRAYYAFDHGEVRFIHLFDNRWVPKWGGLQGEWAKDMAPWVRAQCESFKGKHLVVFGHCPPYTPSKYNDGKPTREIAEQVLTSFTGRYTVTVLGGHTHAYYRTRRKDITFMTVCSGQATNWGHEDLRPEAERDLQPGDVVGDAKVGIAVFTVDGDNLKLNYMGLDGKTIDAADLSLGAAGSPAKK